MRHAVRRPTRGGRAGPFLLVLGIILAGLLVVIVGHRPLLGTGLMAGALGLGALARLLLPVDRTDFLVVRGRMLDVVVLGGLGSVMLVLVASLKATYG